MFNTAKMLILIWTALLQTVTGADQHNPCTGMENKSTNCTITNQKAEAGLGVVLQCLLTNDVKSFAWYKCQPYGKCNQQIINSSNNNNDSKSGGGVSLLETELKKNCSIIFNNFTASDAGMYQVKAEAEKDGRLFIYEANITFQVCPRISNGSSINNCPDVQTCVCLSESCSLPIITWPLLNTTSEYTALATVSGVSVISNMTVFLEYSSNITVKCKNALISKNDCSEIKVNVSRSEEPKTQNTPQNQDESNILDRLKKILEDQLLLLVFGVGILIGSLIAGFIACLATQCCSRKKKSYSTEELELVTTETVPKQFCDDGPLDDDIHNDVAAEVGEEPAVDLVDSDMSPKDTVYSDIDFSAMKEKNPTDAKEQGDATETEYAEIKRGEIDEAQENEGMDCEMLERNHETEVIIEHQGATKQGLLAEEVIGEHVPLCSDTNEEEN